MLRDASDALPPDRSIGSMPVPLKKILVTHPLTPAGEVVALGEEAVILSITSGRNTESMNERWLLARMTAPVFGMFSIRSPTGGTRSSASARRRGSS